MSSGQIHPPVKFEKLLARNFRFAAVSARRSTLGADMAMKLRQAVSPNDYLAAITAGHGVSLDLGSGCDRRVLRIGHRGVPPVKIASD
jgi:hypothetical protein